MTPQLFPNYLSTRLLLLTLKLEKKIRFYVLTGELAAHSPVQQQQSFFTNWCSVSVIRPFNNNSHSLQIDVVLDIVGYHQEFTLHAILAYLSVGKLLMKIKWKY